MKRLRFVPAQNSKYMSRLKTTVRAMPGESFASFLSSGSGLSPLVAFVWIQVNISGHYQNCGRSGCQFVMQPFRGSLDSFQIEWCSTVANVVPTIGGGHFVHSAYEEMCRSRETIPCCCSRCSGPQVHPFSGGGKQTVVARCWLLLCVSSKSSRHKCLVDSHTEL